MVALAALATSIAAAVTAVLGLSCRAHPWCVLASETLPSPSFSSLPLVGVTFECLTPSSKLPEVAEEKFECPGTSCPTRQAECGTMGARDTCVCKCTCTYLYAHAWPRRTRNSSAPANTGGEQVAGAQRDIFLASCARSSPKDPKFPLCWQPPPRPGYQARHPTTCLGRKGWTQIPTSWEHVSLY